MSSCRKCDIIIRQYCRAANAGDYPAARRHLDRYDTHRDGRCGWSSDEHAKPDRPCIDCGQPVHQRARGTAKQRCKTCGDRHAMDLQRERRKTQK